MLHSNIAVEIFACFLYKQKKKQNTTKARSFCALSYRCNTGCTYTFNGKTVYAPPRSVVFVPSGIEYSTNADKGEMMVVHFKSLNYTYDNIEVLDTNASPELVHLFKKLLSKWDNKQMNYKFKTTALFYDILASISINQGDNPQKADELMFKCAEFISSNFENPMLTITDVADFAHISEPYLRRKFNEQFGTSPKKYLINQRIAFAKHLISTEYFTQTEVAEKCGFSDVKYFRTAFKKETGMTINQFFNT